MTLNTNNPERKHRSLQLFGLLAGLREDYAACHQYHPTDTFTELALFPVYDLMGADRAVSGCVWSGRSARRPAAPAENPGNQPDPPMAAECCQRADLCRHHCGKKRQVGTGDRIIRIGLSPPTQSQRLAGAVAADHAPARRAGSHADAGAFSSGLAARRDVGSVGNGKGTVGRASRSEQRGTEIVQLLRQCGCPAVVNGTFWINEDKA